VKGPYAWQRFSPESFQTSISFFKQAIEQEPEYALAHAWLVGAWIIQVTPEPARNTSPFQTLRPARPLMRVYLDVQALTSKLRLSEHAPSLGTEVPPAAVN
jgi:hypothetical protein